MDGGFLKPRERFLGRAIDLIKQRHLLNDRLYSENCCLEPEGSIVQPGKFTVLYGTSYRTSLLLWWSVRCQLPKEKGGWKSSVVWVDGGNTFNPYPVSSLARKHHLDPQSTLEKIFISRAFTTYQLIQLVLQGLDRAVDRYQASLAVISDITTLFSEGGMPFREVMATFNQAAHRLSQLAEERGIAVLVTHPLPSCQSDKSLHNLLYRKADTVVKLEEHCKVLKLVIEKHSDVNFRTFRISLTPSGTLEDFM